VTTSSNGAGAYNATVRVNDPDHIVQAAREQRVADCDRAVEHIETKLAGLQAALTAAKAEATQARAEAQERN
jgi:multidrug resistance efflux pump